jgi:hypothetical protein
MIEDASRRSLEASRTIPMILMPRWAAIAAIELDTVEAVSRSQSPAWS